MKYTLSAIILLLTTQAFADNDQCPDKVFDSCTQYYDSACTVELPGQTNETMTQVATNLNNLIEPSVNCTEGYQGSWKSFCYDGGVHFFFYNNANCTNTTGSVAPEPPAEWGKLKFVKYDTCAWQGWGVPSFKCTAATLS